MYLRLFYMLFFSAFIAQIYGQNLWTGAHPPFEFGTAIVEKDDKVGVINSDNEIIIPLEFDYIERSFDTLFYVIKHSKNRENDSHGVYNNKGKIIIPNKKGNFIEVKDGSNIREYIYDKKCERSPDYLHCKDSTGVWRKIKTKYSCDSAVAFKNGLIVLKPEVHEGHPIVYGLVDNEGKEWLPFVYSSIIIEKDSIRLTLPDDKFTVYRNREDKDVSAFLSGRTFSYAYDENGIRFQMSEGPVVAVSIHDKSFPSFGHIGFLDLKTNQLCGPFKYIIALSYEDGTAFVEDWYYECNSTIYDKYLINKKGQRLGTVEETEMYKLTNQMSIVRRKGGDKDATYELYDIIKGEVLLENTYSAINYVGEGIFQLERDQLFWLYHPERGFLTKTGIDFKFSYNDINYYKSNHKEFDNGYFIFKGKDKRFRFIDTLGQIVPGAYDNIIMPFNEEGIANVEIGNRAFKIDLAGNEILPTSTEIKQKSSPFRLTLINDLAIREDVDLFDFSPTNKLLLLCSKDEERLNVRNIYSNELISSYAINSETLLAKFIDDYSFVVVDTSYLTIYNLLNGTNRQLALRDNQNFFRDSDDRNACQSCLLAAISPDRNKVLISILSNSNDNNNQSIIIVDLISLSTSIVPTSFELQSYDNIGLSNTEMFVFSIGDKFADFHAVNLLTGEVRILHTKIPGYPDKIEVWKDIVIAKSAVGYGKDILSLIDLQKNQLIKQYTNVNHYHIDAASESLTIFTETYGIEIFDLPTRRSKNVDYINKVYDEWSLIGNIFNGTPFALSNSQQLFFHNWGESINILNIQENNITPIPDQEKINHLLTSEDNIAFINNSDHVFEFNLKKFTLKSRLGLIDSINVLNFEKSASTYWHNNVGALNYSQDRKMYASFDLSVGGILTVFDIENSKLLFNSQSNSNSFTYPVPPDFSSDNKFLFYVNSKEKLIKVDLASKKESILTNLEENLSRYDPPFLISPLSNFAFYQDRKDKGIYRIDLENGTTSLFTPNLYGKSIFAEINSQIIAISQGVTNSTVAFYNIETKEKIAEFNLPQFEPNVMVCHPEFNLLIMVSDDGRCKFIDTKTKQLLPLNLFLKGDEYMVYDEEKNFYFGSKSLFQEVKITKGSQIKNYRSMELAFNRPDSLLMAYDFTDKAYANALTDVISRRAANQGVVSGENALQCYITNENLAYVHEQAEFSLKYTIFNSGEPATAVIKILVNGIEVDTIHQLIHEKWSGYSNLSLQIGNNDIEIFALTQDGKTSSSDRAVCLYQSTVDSKKKLYFLGLGNNDFVEWGNLTYPLKDVRTALNSFSQSPVFSEIIVDTFFNQDFSPAIKDCIASNLAKLNVDDYIIVYLSGHGKTDLEDGSFYFIGPNTPTEDFSIASLQIKTLEELLSKTQARNRIGFIDACQSGNVDKSIHYQLVEAKEDPDDGLAKGLKPKKKVAIDQQQNFLMMEQLFNNYDNTFGGTIITASTGYEDAIEHHELGAGVFTYYLTNGLSSLKADLNNDGSIFMSELIEYLADAISQSNYTQQTISIRSLNIKQDFRIW